MRKKAEPSIVELPCYVCGGLHPEEELQNCGGGIYRCKKHRVKTVQNAENPLAVKSLKLSEADRLRVKQKADEWKIKQNMDMLDKSLPKIKLAGKQYIITIPEIKITIEVI